ncbi:MAG: hypothetical protein V4590_00700 [Bacteroidota bacterium]
MNKIYLTLIGFTLLTGCYYDNEEELYPNATTSTTSTTATTVVSYASDIQPMIAANCASSGCHMAGAQIPDLSDYAKLTNNIARVKVRAIDEKSMPAAAPLSNANIAKLQSWIDAGTPNN